MEKYLSVLATHSEIYEKKKSPAEIISFIEKIPLLNFCIMLSQLSNPLYSKDKDINSNYFAKIYLDEVEAFFIEKGITDYKKSDLYLKHLKKSKLLQSREVFSNQTLLNIWKWVLAYGTEEYFLIPQDPQLSIRNIHSLSLFTNDYFSDIPVKDFEQIYAELFSNAIFNSNEKFINSLSRTLIIYTEIAADPNNFRSNFLDINADFQSKYGFSIKQYISLIFTLVANYIQKKPLGDTSLLSDTEVLFANSKLKQEATDLITALSISIPEIKEWAKASINQSWNFIKFNEYPFLRLDDKHVIPYSLKVLEEHLFNGLFHKVRHLYPLNDRRFLDFYGKPFEKYANEVIENSVTQTKIPYELIPEFRYSKTKDSPDILLRLKNKLLAIEIKSYRPRINSVLYSDLHSIQKDTEKMIIKPLKQVHDRIKELQDIEHESLKGVTDFYFMVVTQGHFPSLKPFEEKINAEINSYYEVNSKGHYHLDIEEFELFCSAIEKKRPIFKILDNKVKDSNKYLSFKTFILTNSYHIKRNKFIDSKFKQAEKEVLRDLFDIQIQE